MKVSISVPSGVSGKKIFGPMRRAGEVSLSSTETHTMGRKSGRSRGRSGSAGGYGFCGARAHRTVRKSVWVSGVGVGVAVGSGRWGRCGLTVG